MKKNILNGLVLASALCFAPWACQQPFGVGPQPPSTTPTPTAITTPVCGFTLISLGTKAVSASLPSVIQNTAEWQAFCGISSGMISLTPTPTVVPTPPVNFDSQMLILYTTYVCPLYSLQVTQVCEGPSQITVTANNVESCILCNVAADFDYVSALVVPQSNLPVVWATTTVPCPGLSSQLTPTPTP